MREAPKVVSLAAALSALAAPAVSPAIDDAVTDPVSAKRSAGGEEEIGTSSDTPFSLQTELLSFTVHQASNGTLFPQHGSHSSHSSHSSHVSHASSSGGYGGGYIPSLPNPVYVPPVYPMPPAPPPSTATAPPPQSGVNPIQHACERAVYGYNITFIVTELQQYFGLGASDAFDIAQRATNWVSTGGDYCTPYLGENY